MPNQRQADQIAKGQGFIAALDQSGGSSPKALKLYGVGEERYSGEAEMFDRIHEMRSRIVESPSFTSEGVIGAILFEQTMDREFQNRSAPEFLWEGKGVVPFLKIDQGLAPEEGGMQPMKPLPDLDALLARAKSLGVFGTKERSVIGRADRDGIRRIVDQQFLVGHEVLAHDMVPILEPEVTISIADKAEAEAMLLDALLSGLDSLTDEQRVMMKLTLPEHADFYADLVDHPRVLKVVALSGGYPREEANRRLAQNRGVIASFSRALTEGLSADQSDVEFDRTLAATIASIRDASVAG